jgi:hypothetical protein
LTETKNIFQRKLIWNVGLAVFIFILFFLNYYNKTVFFRPCSVHQWRQADCLSIAKNYYEEGMHFFQPKIHYQGPVEGKAVSEFPILNYTVAFLWKIFGEHEFLYRLLEYLIFVISMFMLFNTMLWFFRSPIIAFFTVSIFFTSPLLTYYSLNFIADVPAFSIGIMCFCTFFKFYYTKKIRLFYLSLFLGTLAVLMKASALMGLSILIFFSLVDIFKLNNIFKTERLFNRKVLPLVLILLSAAIIIGWYQFALYYNANNSNHIFLLTVLPIWELNEDELIYNLKVLFNNLFPLFLNKPMFFLFVGAALFVSAKFKQLDTFFKCSFAVTGVFFIFYILFFFRVFGVHDYYLCNLMVFPVVTFMSCIHIFTKLQFQINENAFIKLFVICVVIFNSFHAAAIYRLRMVEDDKMVYWFPFVSEDERNLSKYLFWDYGIAIKKVENITPDLRAHGIKREDFVLSIPDQSFDISLYFMDQKGFCISRDHLMHDTTVTDQFLHKKIKYVVVSDTALKQQRAFRKLAPHLESFFTHNSVEIFKMKSGS